MEKYLSVLKGKVKKYLPVWCVSIVLGLCVYGQLMSNSLVNAYDGLWEFTYHEAGKWEMSLGRWFWLYIDRLRFGLSNDPWTSILTIVCFSTGICLMLHIFELEQLGITGLIAALFISSTAVCISLSYRYMSPTFGCAFMLSVLAVWFVTRSKSVIGGILFGGISIALMMGLYQAYLGCTCLLIIGYFLWRLTSEDSVKKISGKFLECVLMLLVGGIVYVLLLNLHLKVFHVALSSYNGADTYSVLNTLQRLPETVKASYQIFSLYFWGDMYKINMLQDYGIYHAIFAIFGISLLVEAVRVWRISHVKSVLLLVLVCLIPIACNAVMLVATDGGISLQMTGAFALCIPVMGCVIFKIKFGSRVWRWMRSGVIVVLLLLLWGNIYQVQMDQNAMYEGKIATTAMTAGMMNTMAEEECLDDDLQYCFIGLPAGNELFFVSEAYEKANRYAQFGMGWGDPGSAKKSWNGIWHYIYGVNLPIYSTEECQEALIEADWEKMPVYPQKGYMKRMGNVVIIKVSE